MSSRSTNEEALERDRGATTMVPQCNPDGLVNCSMLVLGKGGGGTESSAGIGGGGKKADSGGGGGVSGSEEEGAWTLPASDARSTVPKKHPPRIVSYSEESVIREDVQLIKWKPAGPNTTFVPSPEMQVALDTTRHLRAPGARVTDTAKSDPRFSVPHIAPAQSADAPGQKAQKPQFASKDDRAFLMHNLLSPVECRNLMKAAESHLEPLDKYFVENYRAGSRALLMVPKVADCLYRRLAKKLTPQDYQDRIPLCFGQSGVWIPLKLNDCFKVLKYEPPTSGSDPRQEEFLAHRDGPWVPREDQASIYTVLFYLTEGFIQGHTELSAQPPPNSRRHSFGLRPEQAVYVAPVTGSALFFNHDIYHSGRALGPESKGAKWVAKTELIMQRVHSYHVDRYYFLKMEDGGSGAGSSTATTGGVGGAQAYQKMKELYAASQAAMLRGEREQFVELYQEVVSMQRDAMMETQERRFLAAQRKKPKLSDGSGDASASSNDDDSTSSVSLFHSQGHFISAKLNADVLGDILGFLSASEVVAMLPVSQGAYFSLLQSNTWRLRLEAEFPEVVRFGDPSEGFFASSPPPLSSDDDEEGEDEQEGPQHALLRRILFEQTGAKKETTRTTGQPHQPQQQMGHLQSPPECVEAAIWHQPSDQLLARSAGGKFTAADGEKKHRKKIPAGTLPPHAGVMSSSSSGAFDWYALYLQRRTLRHRFLPFGFWPRRDKPPLLLKDRSVTRSGMFSRATGGQLPRFYDRINETRDVGTGEPVLGKHFAVLEVPGWFLDPIRYQRSHHSIPDVCRLKVSYDRGPNGKKGICTVWHPDLSHRGRGGGRENLDRYSIVRERQEDLFECQDIEWSAFRGSLMHSVDTAFHPMLLLGLPQWWIEDSPGQERLPSSLKDCFELLRVPAIRIVHPAVAAVIGHLVDTKGEYIHRKREELPNPAAAFMGVVSVSLEEEKVLYLTIVDTVDLVVVRSVPLSLTDELASHELLEVSTYNKNPSPGHDDTIPKEEEHEGNGAATTPNLKKSGGRGRGGRKKRGGVGDIPMSDSQIRVLYQNIDLSDAAWNKFVTGEVRNFGDSNSRNFATEEVTMLGLREMMGRLDFREKCLFRPVA